MADASQIVDLDGELEPAPGQDRRRAMALVFTLCLAVGSAFLGRDGPVATQGISSPDPGWMFTEASGAWVGTAPADGYLSLPPNTTDALLSSIPKRLASEALPPLQFVPIRIRAVSGLAVEARRPGDYQMVTWSEGGNVYWLVSDRWDVSDLLRLADSLR